MRMRTSLFLIAHNYDFIICKLSTYNGLFNYIWCIIYQLGCFLGWLESESRTFINCTKEAGMTRCQMHHFLRKVCWQNWSLTVVKQYSEYFTCVNLFHLHKTWWDIVALIIPFLQIGNWSTAWPLSMITQLVNRRLVQIQTVYAGYCTSAK